MSKFDYDIFCDGDYTALAVSKEKHSKEEAIKLAKFELDSYKPYYLLLENGYVRHRAGVTDDGERRVCWWLEDVKNDRSCPCWVLHIHNREVEGYECILVN